MRLWQGQRNESGRRDGRFIPAGFWVGGGGVAKGMGDGEEGWRVALGTSCSAGVGESGRSNNCEGKRVEGGDHGLCKG